MSPKLEQPITASVLLDAGENAVIGFLTQRHRHGRFDVSSIVDFDTLSTAEREELSTKLM